jgi:hypothetical protein
MTDRVESIQGYRFWQANALTLFGILYAAILTVTGVLVAAFWHDWRVVAWAAIAILVGMWGIVFKYRLIGWLERYLAWPGRGKRLL